MPLTVVPPSPGLGWLAAAPLLAALGVALTLLAWRRGTAPLATTGALCGAVAAALAVFAGLWWSSRAFGLAQRGGWPCSLALAATARAELEAALSATLGTTLGLVAALGGLGVARRRSDAVRFRALLTAALVAVGALVIAVQRGAPSGAAAAALGRPLPRSSQAGDVVAVLCHAPLLHDALAQGVSTRGCEQLDDTLRTTGAPGHDAAVAALAARCAELTRFELERAAPADRAALVEARLGSAWAAAPELRARLAAAAGLPPPAPDAGAPP